MESSKVRIEATECVSGDKFNHWAIESGTTGGSEIGIDLGVVIQEVPRPLFELCRAIKWLDDKHHYGGLAADLVKAASAYLEEWEKIDGMSGGQLRSGYIVNNLEAIYEKLHGPPA